MQRWTTIATCSTHKELAPLINKLRRQRTDNRPYRRWPNWITTQRNGVPTRHQEGWAIQAST